MGQDFLTFAEYSMTGVRKKAILLTSLGVRAQEIDYLRANNLLVGSAWCLPSITNRGQLHALLVTLTSSADGSQDFDEVSHAHTFIFVSRWACHMLG